MRKSLGDMKNEEIHQALLGFDTDDKVKAAAVCVSELIHKIEENDADKQWFFRDENGPSMMTTDKDGRPIEFIKGQYHEPFPWREYKEVISKIGKHAEA